MKFLPSFRRKQPAPQPAAKGRSNLILVRRVLSESLRRFWPRYALGFFFLAVISATTSASAWLMGEVVNRIFVDRDLTMLWLISGGVVGLFIVKGLATYFEAVTMARVGNRIVALNQERVFNHLMKLDVRYFSENESSTLIMSVSQGSTAANSLVDLIVTSLGRDVLTLAGLIFVMVLKAPLLAALSLAIGPFAVIGVMRLGKRIKSISRSELFSLATIIGVLQETAHGARIVKSYGLKGYMAGRMQAAVLSVERMSNKMAALQARTSPLMETLGGIAIGMVILASGWQTIEYNQSPGEFMAFITALLLAYEPAKRLARLHVSLQAILMGVQMMFGILDLPPGKTESEDGPDLKLREGSIEFENVSFSYRPKTPVLQRVSTIVHGGETVALVGPSGGGKTTILSLIQRFYDPDNGTVSIDGQDLRTLGVSSIRAAIAFVSQDTYLFSGSLRDNIRLGRLTATDAEIEDAARSAHAEDFILDLPQGYDTHVGENGVQLSGGQRQRIAIARALLKNAPIVLLDEATSALDSETERKIRDALAHLTAGRTTIVIAHRLSTVMDADRILVVQAGRIVEEGRHEDLLRKGGLYQHLSKLQFADKRHDAASPPSLSPELA